MYSHFRFLKKLHQLWYEIAVILRFAGQHIIIEPLLPVNECHCLLQFRNGLEQGFFFLCKDHLAFRDCTFARQTECQICFHFRKAHATAFQAVQALNPFDIMLVKYTIIPLTPSSRRSLTAPLPVGLR